MLKLTRHIILSVIDFFHRPFERWISVNNFRYLACGGFNAVLDTVIYFVTFNYWLTQPVTFIGGMGVSRHIVAFLVSFTVSFPLGFSLSKYIVFPHSDLKGRVQLFRYALLVSTCILLNYIFLKVFVEYFHFVSASGDATPSKILTTALVAVFSFVAQRHFTFKVRKEIPVRVEESR